MKLSQKTIKSILPKNKTARIVVIVILVLIALYTYNEKTTGPDFLVNGSSDIPDDALTVTYLDIGQGDAIYITFPTGENMLIDAGPNDSETALIAQLDRLDVSSLDWAVFTHPHEDHIGGAEKILDVYEVENVLLSPAESETSTYTRMMSAIYQEGSTVYTAEAEDVYAIGDATVTVLGPHTYSEDDANNASILLRLDYKDTSFLFTGDVEASGENIALHKLGEDAFDIDVLKVAHHGSSTSSSEDFLDVATPRIAVISCGENNDYGHPHSEILAALNERGTTILRTDRDGAICIYSDGESYGILTEEGTGAETE